ncbi:MAG: hypothetical protein NTW87_11775 [Planctomycetota bacterium]|nr:hypothetical protein [Planctomycetota bacterium]
MRHILCLLSLALVPLVGRAGEAEKPKEAAFPYLLTALQAMDAAECRTKALDAEKAEDWPGALTAWERVIDRCPSTEEQRIEARAHIKELRPKVPRNTDPEKAHPWKVLVVIFRKLEFSWTDAKNNQIAVEKTVSEDNEKKIRGSIEAFGKHVFQFSSGMLRLDTDIKVLDEPLTKLHGQGQGPFTPAPHLLRPAIDPLIKEKTYDTVIAYVKYNGDKGPSVPAPFVAATFGSCGDFKGAGFIMVPWHTNYPFPGETDGEMETHEWLHQIDWMFCHVLHYPDPLVPSSDSGRMEGDNRPGGDQEYARKKTETTWIKLYQHIMEDHITRQMWTEATMHATPGQPLPGDVCKAKK